MICPFIDQQSSGGNYDCNNICPLYVRTLQMCSFKVLAIATSANAPDAIKKEKEAGG